MTTTNARAIQQEAARSIPKGFRLQHCERCGAPTFHSADPQTGARLELDLEPIEVVSWLTVMAAELLRSEFDGLPQATGWERYTLVSGVVVTPDVLPDLPRTTLYRSHFASCPERQGRTVHP